MSPVRNGFTLVEVLVALAVSALVLTIVFAGLGKTLDRERRSQQSIQALAFAQTQINRRSTYTHREGEWGGSQNGLYWSVNERAVLKDPRGSRSLDQITATVTDPKGRELVTLSRRAIRKTPDLP